MSVGKNRKKKHGTPHLHGRSVGENGTSNVKTFTLVEVEVDRLALIGELACRAKTRPEEEEKKKNQCD